jgi:hypothetical protein
LSGDVATGEDQCCPGDYKPPVEPPENHSKRVVRVNQKFGARINSMQPALKRLDFLIRFMIELYIVETNPEVLVMLEGKQLMERKRAAIVSKNLIMATLDLLKDGKVAEIITSTDKGGDEYGQEIIATIQRAENHLRERGIGIAN